jgi:hypothetical protein
MEKVGTEKVYLYLNSRAKIFDEESKIRNLSMIQNETKNKENNILSEEYIFKDTLHWLYNSFVTYINNNSVEYPLNPEEEKWKRNETNNNSSNEIRNLIYKLQKEINYDQKNNIINAEVLLKGESKFWIFLHYEEKFNDKTVVIILSKEDLCKRCFVSIGSFVDKKIDNTKINNMISNSLNIKKIQKKILYESNSDLMNSSSSRCHNIDNNIDNNIDINEDYDSDNNINYINCEKNDENIEYDFVIFKTQELVEDISIEAKKKRNKKKSVRNYSDMNICLLKINVLDDGRNISLKIKLNEGTYENEISGSCFRSAFDVEYITNISSSYKSPTYKNMIAGSGEGCNVLLFSNKFVNKTQKFGYHSKEPGCQCCIIN